MHFVLIAATHIFGAYLAHQSLRSWIPSSAEAKNSGTSQGLPLADVEILRDLFRHSLPAVRGISLGDRFVFAATPSSAGIPEDTKSVTLVVRGIYDRNLVALHAEEGGSQTEATANFTAKRILAELDVLSKLKA